MLREYAHQAIKEMNDSGEFDKPLLWYYSPMDASWSLGHFENRGIVYDSMDELSQFTGAPRSLIANEKRLMEHSDVVFTGGYELYLKKKQQHPNVHFLRLRRGVRTLQPGTGAGHQHPAGHRFHEPPDLGWFGVVDERVDYIMVGEMARMRPEWSFAMVGPVVKVDPNLLPHYPNLYWLGGRDYSGVAELLPRIRCQHDVLRDQRGHAVHQSDQGAGISGNRQAGHQHAREGCGDAVQRHGADRPHGRGICLPAPRMR